MGGNAAKSLQFEKVLLYQMALFIQPPVAAPLEFGSFFRRVGWFPAIFIDIIDQILAVITSIRKYTVSFHIYMLQYRDGKIDVCPISFEGPPFFTCTVLVSLDNCSIQ